MFMQPNWLAVVAAAVSACVIGGLWYGPLFKNAWCREAGIDLRQKGFPTLVPRECVGGRAEAPHEANLFDIQAKYADVVSVEKALAYMESVPARLGAPA